MTLFLITNINVFVKIIKN